MFYGQTNQIGLPVFLSEIYSSIRLQSIFALYVMSVNDENPNPQNITFTEDNMGTYKNLFEFFWQV